MRLRSTATDRVILLGLALVAVLIVGLNLTDWWAALLRSAGAMRLNEAVQQQNAAPSAYEPAAAILARASALDPGGQAAGRLYGYALLGLSQEAAALEAWRGVEGMADELVTKGRAAELAADDDAAEAWYLRALAVRPDHADAWFLLGQTRLRQEDWHGAAEAFGAGLELPFHATYRPGDFGFFLSQALSNQKPTDWKAVIAAADRAIASEDFQSEWARIQSHHERGEAHRILGHYDEAAEDFAWVLAQRPDDYWATVRSGDLAWVLDRDAAEAERLLRTAIALDPKSKWAYRDLAGILSEAGRPNEAAELYRSVLALDPDDQGAAAMLSALEQDE